MKAEELSVKDLWRAIALQEDSVAENCIAAAIRTAEAEAYRRGQEAFRERVLGLNMLSYDEYEEVRALPIEDETTPAVGTP